MACNSGVFMQSYAKTGGILSIISGTFCIFYAAIGILFILFAVPWQLGSDIYYPSQGRFFMIFGSIFVLVFILLGALAISGGTFALKKKHWKVAIAGAVAGAILFSPCGIPALILISIARNEFCSINN